MTTIQRAVKEFIAHSEDFYQLLRADGQALCDVDLVALREQLYLLDTEADRLQDAKESDFDDSLLVFDRQRPHRQAA
jgi:hypothetical protein